MMIIVVSAIVVLYLQQVFFQYFSQRGLSAKVSFKRQEMTAGERNQISIYVSNRKRFPLSAVSLSFRLNKNIRYVEDENNTVSDYTYRYDVFSVGAYEKVSRDMDISCGQRGCYKIEELELITNDLFYTRVFHQKCRSDSMLYVYPEPVKADLAAEAARKLYGEMAARTFLVEDPYEFTGIRKYQPYDGLRYINWKASARQGEWVVNQKGSMSDQKVVVLLNATGAGGYNQILMEKGIAIAYSVVELLIAQGIQTGLISNGTDQEDGQVIRIEAGASREHGRAVGRCLARLKENMQMDSFEKCIQELMEGRKNEDTVYVMISEAHAGHVEMFQKLEAYCEGAQMILLKMQDTRTENFDCLASNIMVWEVPYA